MTKPSTPPKELFIFRYKPSDSLISEYFVTTDLQECMPDEYDTISLVGKYKLVEVGEVISSKQEFLTVRKYEK